MVRMQFHYYMDKYRLKKYTLDGEETFFLYDLAVTFHEHPKHSYATVMGFIPYLLLKELPEVDPTPVQFLNADNPSNGNLEIWAFSRCFGDYLQERLIQWETSETISTAEMMREIRKEKKALLAQKPEEFFLSTCHFFTIQGLATFLEKTTAFYTKK